MLLKVYDQYKNAVGYIRKYTDLEIDSELETGDKTLSFTYQNKDLKVGDGEIANEYYIETPDDLYVVKEIGIDSSGYPEIVCQLDLEELEAEMVESFSAENMSIQDVANLALVGTGWRADTEGIDPEKLRSVATLKATPYTILGKIRDAWMCKMRFDTKEQIVYFRDEFGEDRGVFFSKTLNLRRLKLTDDSYDFYTRIVPIGEDDLRIDDVNDGKGYVENYQYSDKVKTLIWEDTSYTDAEALKEDAEAKLDDMSKPSRSYSADVVDLAKQSEKYSIMDFELGDTITLLDQESDIKDKQRIVKLKEYPDNPYKNSCELSNTTWTWEELQSKLQAAADAFEDISNSDGTVNGYYVHGITSDGVLVLEKTVNPDGTTTTTTIGSLTDNLVTINNNVQEAYDSVLSVVGDIITISGELDVVYERVGTLEATSLTATEADLRYATIGSLDVVTADIENLYALYGNITSLVTDELAAKVANIENVLSGQIGTGSLESIVITTENAYVESAVILDALIGTVLADIIDANTIYTDVITIMSENGGIVISGNTIQISDENGIVRMQIGQDADGGFTFVIYDETGTGIMIDSEGIHESAVPDGLIVNDMVSDDANISASKLDIADLTQTLNENGQLILSAEQITIGGGTLDYTLTEIQQQISELESYEGIEYVENYYAITSTPDWYPPQGESGDGSQTSILGEMVLGEAILGYGGASDWTTERLVASDGEYLWYSQLITYSDGHTVWTTPTLITDDYIRTTVTVTQTELEVVQGQIQAKVWMSDIESVENELGQQIDSISEQYGDLVVTVDSISSEVGQLTTVVDEINGEYEELYSTVSNLTVDLDGISATVQEVADKTSNAITEGVPYYTASDSPDWYTPHGVEEETAVLGDMILGTAELGADPNGWTTEQPEYEEGMYTWVSYYRTRVDGSTYWTTPTLLTDEWERTKTNEISEQYAGIVIQIGNITSEVSSIYTEMSEDFYSRTQTDALIEQSANEIYASIIYDVSMIYATQDQLTEMDASITQYVDESVAEITLQVQSVEGNLRDEMSTITTELGDITARVDDFSDALVSDTPYYAVSDSATWYPPFDPDPSETSVLGKMVLGTGVLGVSGEDWSLEQPENADGQYVWVAYYRELAEGDPYWTTPMLLTDDYMRTTAVEIIDRYSQLVLQVDSAVLEVGEIEHSTARAITDGVAYYGISARPDIVPGDDPDAEDTALYGKGVWGKMLLGNYPVWSTEQPTPTDDTYIWVKYLITNVDGSTYWTVPTLLTDDAVKKRFSKIELTINSISLTVQDDDNGMAAIIMTVGDDTSEVEAVVEARKAFANESSSVVITAGTVAFVSNTLVVDSRNFQLDEYGNATFSGNLSAPTGTIGGWNIDKYNLFNVDIDNGVVYLSPSMILLGATNVTVDTNGNVVSQDAKFYVDRYGNMHAESGTFSGTLSGASGSFSGTITALSGTIGNWSITSSSIQTGSYNTSDAMYFGSNGLSLSDAFRVSSAGVLTATGASITGTIDATSIRIQNNISMYYGSNEETILNVNGVSNGHLQISVGLPSTNNYIYMCYDSTDSNGYTQFWSSKMYFGQYVTSSYTNYAICFQGSPVYFSNNGNTCSTTTSVDANVSLDTAATVSVTGNSYSYRRLARSSSSSKTYKNTVNPLSESSVEKYFDIPIYTFKYNDDYLSANDERYGKSMPGFLAEDWESVNPIAVDHDADGKPEMWNSKIVIPIMYEMIKSNHTNLTAEQAEIAELKERLAEAESEIATLKQQTA